MWPKVIGADSLQFDVLLTAADYIDLLKLKTSFKKSIAKVLWKASLNCGKAPKVCYDTWELLQETAND